MMRNGLLLSDPTHFETEIQQLKAKMAELSTEVAALKSKGSMFGYYNVHDVYYICKSILGCTYY